MIWKKHAENHLVTERVQSKYIPTLQLRETTKRSELSILGKNGIVWLNA